VPLTIGYCYMPVCQYITPHVHLYRYRFSRHKYVHVHYIESHMLLAGWNTKHYNTTTLLVDSAHSEDVLRADLDRLCEVC
jgi:hypothetical protein